MPQRFDVVIIGGGHNGLVAAAYLARAGRKVLVLERRDLVGGSCVTEEVWPGFRVSTAAYLASLLDAKVIRELELDPERVNVNGSGIALGHPIGATGARIIVTLLHELEKRKARLGLATLCVGGGMGMAMAIEREG